MNKTKGLDFIKRYTMILVLIVVTAFFAWRTGGAILLPMNVSSLISQNMHGVSQCPPRSAEKDGEHSGVLPEVPGLLSAV